MYKTHRETLFNQLPDNSVAIVASGSEQIRNRDVEYHFRAHSDFQYLTGFEEPDAVLLLVKKEQTQTALFLREKDPEKETWEGRRLGVEKACETLDVDYSYAIGELVEHALGFIQDCENIFISFSELGEWIAPINEWIEALKQQVRKGIVAPSNICDLDNLLHEMRLFKTDAEIDLMRQAAQISVAGHKQAILSVLNSQYEYQVQAELEATFKKCASPRVAFNSIVANGENACILHYTENNAELDKSALVLVDAGAEFGGYAGDITTTFPASGKFSEPQAQLYSLVLKAQQAAIKVIKPGVAYDEMHQTSVKVLTQGLIELGILKGELQQLIKDEAYKAFFMHGTGHWLGMDVHDVGRYKIDSQWRNFEPGMVVTVEPGLYISSEHTQVDAKWHNIGIRIEDDVLVTADGNEILTIGLPRSVQEIEAFMGQYDLDCCD